jgi:hypothetical protein
MGLHTVGAAVKQLGSVMSSLLLLLLYYLTNPLMVGYVNVIYNYYFKLVLFQTNILKHLVLERSITPKHNHSLYYSCFNSIVLNSEYVNTDGDDRDGL